MHPAAQPPPISLGSVMGFRPADGMSWTERLEAIENAMRAVSRHTDPQAAVLAYRDHLDHLMPDVGRFTAISRRDLPAPYFRVTRSDLFKEEINPWAQRDQLPIFKGGVLGELIYGEKPVLWNDFHPDPADPAYEYLRGLRSLAAAPTYERGESLNMVVVGQPYPNAFNPDSFPDWVLMSNLFGRATHNLVLMEQLRQAYEQVDQELKAVAAMQRALLPATLPQVPSLSLAAHYQTSARAGGDYYDFFPLPDGNLGILIADVSGHGTPAAVMMAITHAIAHQYPGPPMPPGQVLSFVNRKLTELYTGSNSTFVTAFYGIYRPADRTLWYAAAGHNPPRVKRCGDGSTFGLDKASGLPMGIMPDETYEEATQQLVRGDQIIFYTDGITEAMNPLGEQYGTDRLDQSISLCSLDADALIQSVLSDLERFTAGAPANDDRTVLVAKLR
jgi:sigma-B regulation protein RsbU (phosphoserine phosphatase)